MCSAITGIDQWHPRKSLRPRAQPPTPKNKRKRNFSTPNLERPVSSCEPIFASLSSRTMLANDHINSHHKVRSSFSLCWALFCISIPDFATVEVDALGFFYSALPPEGELSLDELHLIVRDIWLTRYDQDLEQERARRRKGRPKSAKETQIEELKVREAEEYRTGFGSSLSAKPKRGFGSSLFHFPSRSSRFNSRDKCRAVPRVGSEGSWISSDVTVHQDIEH